jgi:RNA polymerase sigma-70 factor (ECF subfamily)
MSKGGLVTLKDSVAIRSHQEIADAIRAFTPAQWVRLRKVSQRYGGPHFEPKDLLQEAFRRALEEDGGRNCPIDVDIVKFVADAMRSIANGELGKAKGCPPLVAVANHGGEHPGVDPPDPSLNAEEFLARDQDAAAIRRHILSLFDDDPCARDIVEGTMAELTAEELRELTGLDGAAYASKRRLIRRRIDNKYPKGWMP